MGSSVGRVLWKRVLATSLVQTFSKRGQGRTLHLDCFAETLEVVVEEGGIGKEVRVKCFLYMLR